MYLKVYRKIHVFICYYYKKIGVLDLAGTQKFPNTSKADTQEKKTLLSFCTYSKEVCDTFPQVVLFLYPNGFHWHCLVSLISIQAVYL